MTPRRMSSVGLWSLLGVSFALGFAGALFRGEFVARATAAGLSRNDAWVVLEMGRFWALPGFALGALCGWFRPRLGIWGGIGLSLLGSLYAFAPGADWRLVGALVAIGGACSLLAVYAALAEELGRRQGSLAQRTAPVALFVSVEHLTPLLTPKIGSLGLMASAACWALGLGLSCFAPKASSQQTNVRDLRAPRRHAWLGPGALVIFGAIWVPNSLVTPGEFAQGRALVFEWTLCLALLAIALVPAVVAWLTPWRALVLGLGISAGSTCSAVLSGEAHVPFVTWLWVVGAALAGALLYRFAFSVFLAGGRRVSAVMLFWYFSITRGASGFYYWIQNQELPGGFVGVLVAFASVPLFLALLKWERRFSRLLMLDA